VSLDSPAVAEPVVAVIKLGTDNARSMAEGNGIPAGRLQLGRPVLLHKQVRTRGVHVTGNRESRSAQGYRELDGFLVLALGSLRGGWGCEPGLMSRAQPVMGVTSSSGDPGLWSGTPTPGYWS